MVQNKCWDKNIDRNYGYVKNFYIEIFRCNKYQHHFISQVCASLQTTRCSLLESVKNLLLENHNWLLRLGKEFIEAAC